MVSTKGPLSFWSIAAMGAVVMVLCLVLAIPAALGERGRAETAEPAASEPSVSEPEEAPSRLAQDIRASEERRWLCSLAAAVNEAHENCALLAESSGLEVWLQLDFQRAKAAVEENPLVHAGTYGELPALIGTLRFLESYRKASADPRSLDALLSARDYSEEDIRFLAGFIHWYLGIAYEHWRERFEVDPFISRAFSHEGHATRFDPERLRAFKGKDFQTLLGEMD